METTSTYRITTQADTRSKSRQARTWEMEAASEDDAMYEAKMCHVKVVGWNASVWVEEVEWLRLTVSGS
jgi:hypothetical protein